MNLRRRLASQSSIVFGLRITGAGIAFLTQALIARTWGSALLGEYLVFIAIANLFAAALPLGFQTVGAYFAADYAAKGEGKSLRQFLIRAYGHTLFPGSLILLVGGYFAAHWANDLSDTSRHLTEAWLPIALLAFATALIYVNGAVLIGLKRPYAGFLPDTLMRPLIMLTGFLITVVWLDSHDGMVPFLWFLALGFFAVAAIHFWVAIRAALKLPTDMPFPEKEPRRWWHFAMPWFALSLFSDFFFDIDLLLLANVLDHEQIAIFGVCTRIFVLTSFGISAVYAVSVPDIMKNEAQKDAAGLVAKIADANIVATGLSFVLLLLVVIFSPFVLALFGEPFLAGVTPLAIICSALIVRSVFGPTSIILSARNYPYASLPAIGIGLFGLVVGNWVLVPPFGLLGAAGAAFFAFMLGSIVLWYTALRLTGLDVSLFSRMRSKPKATSS